MIYLNYSYFNNPFRVPFVLYLYLKDVCIGLHRPNLKVSLTPRVLDLGTVIDTS